MENVKFALAVVGLCLGVYYLSLLWYRTRGDGWIATAMRMGPIGLVVFPAACLALAFATQPDWTTVLGMPAGALLITGSAYLGLRRAAKDRPDTLN
jgi:hypothetical protein